MFSLLPSSCTPTFSCRYITASGTEHGGVARTAQLFTLLAGCHGGGGQAAAAAGAYTGKHSTALNAWRFPFLAAACLRGSSLAHRASALAAGLSWRAVGFVLRAFLAALAARKGGCVLTYRASSPSRKHISAPAHAALWRYAHTGTHASVLAFACSGARV